LLFFKRNGKEKKQDDGTLVVKQILGERERERERESKKKKKKKTKKTQGKRKRLKKKSFF
jgi:hypothetical protein